MEIKATEIRNDLSQKLLKLSSRRKQRKLSEIDLNRIMTAIERHRGRLGSLDPPLDSPAGEQDGEFDEIEVILCGGLVPNSYKWKAETDIARVIISKRSRRVYVEVGRFPASKVSKGCEGFLTVVARHPGEGKNITLESTNF